MAKPGLQQMFNCVTLKSAKICLCGLLLLSACVTVLAASIYNRYLTKYSLSDVALAVLALPNVSLLDVRTASVPMHATSSTTLINASSLDVEAAIMPAQVTSTILPEVSSSMPSVGSSPLSIMPKCGYPGIRCSSKSRYRIYVSRKSYIFQQMSDAVVQGLRSRKNLCRYEVLEAGIDSQYAGKAVRGDVWIHIGYSKEEIFFKRCKEKFAPLKVYCIFFNSEPRKVEAPKGVCEIWDYTHGNQPIAPVVRYLPPGFVPVYKHVSENDLAVQKRSEGCKRSKLELFFLGNVSKLLRKHCWNHLQQLPALQHLTFTSTERGVRSLEAMQKLVSKRNTIFLNMHPLCNQSAGSSYPSERLETVRLSVLLSFGALVISEPANAVDMQLYQDIVIFEKNLFRAFSTWSLDLQELLGNCTKIREFQLQAYESFKKRFHPGWLLENAGILEIASAIRPDSSTALRV